MAEKLYVRRHRNEKTTLVTESAMVKERNNYRSKKGYIVRTVKGIIMVVDKRNTKGPELVIITFAPTK